MKMNFIEEIYYLSPKIGRYSTKIINLSRVYDLTITKTIIRSIHIRGFMKKIFLILGIVASVLRLNAQENIVDKEEISRILNTLASDDMRGRHALSPDIEKAADFISDEFRKIGLEPYAEENYRQTFHLTKVAMDSQRVTLNHIELSPENFMVFGSPEYIHWGSNSAVKISSISSDEDFSQKFRSISRNGEGDEVIWVAPSHGALLARFKRMIGNENLLPSDQANQQRPTKVFIVADEQPQHFEVFASTSQSEIPLFNVIGMLPGKSKPEEYVIFSAHYDHIGIIEAVGQDSIANGADDDASGTTAVIALAKYYKNLAQNDRTLLFVAFTAEEIGMFGSKYFSTNIDPEQVVAMINIEMIGKDARFGPNSMYMTGFDASNLGELMQKNLEDTEFTFHPDPYPQQNLFYRSDNATLAALGVPAHTLSTVQIEKDEYYHTVKDEVSTLDIDNIKSSIEAIAKGAIGIVNGTQTPTRVEKLR